MQFVYFLTSWCIIIALVLPCLLFISFCIFLPACITPGVIAMAWCPDSSYLITCAKDSRTICWDTVSGEVWTYCTSTIFFNELFPFMTFLLGYGFSVEYLVLCWCFFILIDLDCLWIACWQQLEFWCTLVSEDTWGHISIFIWWKSWFL